MRHIKCIFLIIASIVLLTSCAITCSKVEEDVNDNRVKVEVYYTDPDEKLRSRYNTFSDISPNEKALNYFFHILVKDYGDRLLFQRSGGTGYKIIELVPLSGFEYTDETRAEVEDILTYLSLVYKNALELCNIEGTACILLIDPNDSEYVLCSAEEGEIDFSYLDHKDEIIYTNESIEEDNFEEATK